MWLSSGAVKGGAAKAAQDDRFLLVHSGGLVALAVPVVLPEAAPERSRREWSRLVLRRSRALPVLTGDRNRVPVPG